MKQAVVLASICIALFLSSCGAPGGASSQDRTRTAGEEKASTASTRIQWDWTVSLQGAQVLYLEARDAHQSQSYDAARELLKESVGELGRLPEDLRTMEALQLLRHLEKLAAELDMHSSSFKLWKRHRAIIVALYESESGVLPPNLADEERASGSAPGGGLAQDELLSVPGATTEESEVDGEFESQLRGEFNPQANEGPSVSGAPLAEATATGDVSMATSALEAALEGAEQELSEGRPEAAATRLQGVLKETSSILGPGDPARLRTELNLAKIHLARGLLDEARLLLEEVLVSLESDVGVDAQVDEGQLHELHTVLADTLMAQGEFVQASDLLEEQFNAQSQHLDDDSPSRFALGDRLVAAWAAAGDFERARALGEELLNQRRESLGPGHPQVSERQLQMAWMAELAGDLPGARSHLDRYFEDLRRRNNAGGSGPFSAHQEFRAHRNLAYVLEGLGEFEGARSHLERYFAWLESSGSMRAHERDNVREFEARLVEGGGDLAGAQQRFEALLDEYQQRFTPDHPRIQAMRQSLARVLSKQGDKRGAEVLQAEACEALARTLPVDDPSLGLARSKLIAMQVELEDVDRALMGLSELLATEVVNEGSTTTLAQMRLTAAGYQRDCQLVEAMALREEIVDRSREAFPAGHPLVVEDMREFAAILRVLGHTTQARALELQWNELQAIPGSRDEHWGEALEAAHKTFAATGQAPQVELAVPVVTESGDVFIEATIQDPTGILDWIIVQDGIERGPSDASVEWIPNAEGTRGQLRLSLRMPSDQEVTLVEVSASNFGELRGAERVVARGPLSY